MSISLSNYREWLPFAIIAVGIVLALTSAFLPHRKQQFQKSLKLLAAFRASLHAHDLDHWREVYYGTRDVAGAAPGYFVNHAGNTVLLASMWASDEEDQTSIQRMAECLEKACTEILTNTTDIKTMWYEIGQLLESMHQWMRSIPGAQADSTFLDEQYPAIRTVFEKYEHRFAKWPYLVYTKQ